MNIIYLNKNQRKLLLEAIYYILDCYRDEHPKQKEFEIIQAKFHLANIKQEKREKCKKN